MSPTKMKSIRTELGLSQPQMARVLAIQNSITVSRYERGTCNPSPTIAMLYDELADGWQPKSLQTILEGRAS